MAILEAANDLKLLGLLLNAMHGNFEPGNIRGLGRIALSKAIQSKDLMMVRAILSSPLWINKSKYELSFAMYYALMRDGSPPYLDIIRMLLSFGADPNTAQYDSNKETSALLIAVISNSLESVDLQSFHSPTDY